MKQNKYTSIIIPGDVYVWPHELKSVQSLANAGYDVEFLRTLKNDRAKSPDIIMDKLLWEIKSPKTDKLSAIERNLKRATKQSENIIIDSRRMVKLHDNSIQKMLIKKYKEQKTIKRLLFINRKREVIDISTLI